MSRMKYGIFLLLAIGAFADAQAPPDALERVSRSASLTFVERDGSCLRGTILKADASTVTVEPFRQPAVTLKRDDIVQVSQGNAYIYSARSSWGDVSNLKLYPREAIVLTTVKGQKIKGAPVKVTPDEISLQHGLKTTVFPKSEVAAVDYLRLKPATDGFNLALEESPWALIFYPEFYYRLAGGEGRLTVRLYDASKPEDRTSAKLGVCPHG